MDILIDKGSDLTAAAAPAPPRGPHLEKVLEQTGAVEPRRKIEGVLIGTFVGPHADGALVDYPGNAAGEPVAAAATADVTDWSCGCDVALLFQGGDPRKPLLIGKLHQPLSAVPDGAAAPQASIDDEVLTFTARREIVLKCGKASITLTRAGKIILRGTYVLSRSSGVNRIKGGSVQIN